MAKKKFSQEEYKKILSRFEISSKQAINRARQLGFFTGSPTDSNAAQVIFKPEWTKPNATISKEEILVFINHFIDINNYLEKNMAFMVEKIDAIRQDIKYFKLNSPAFAMTQEDLVSKKFYKYSNLPNPYDKTFDPHDFSTKPVDTIPNDFLVTDYLYNDRLLPSMYDRCIEITLDELTKAIKSAPEYWYPILYTPLIQAFSKPDMYTLVIKEPRVMGAMSRISAADRRRTYAIRINAEEVAGTPEELAEAVTATRMRLGYGDEAQGERATNAWYMGLYKVAREGRHIYVKRAGDESASRDPALEERRTAFYNTILRARLESLQGRPAYWYLLNYGNKNVDRMGESNKGGTGRPENPPTHFIEKAEKRINEMLVQVMFTGIEETPTTFGSEGTVQGLNAKGEMADLPVNNLEPGIKEISRVNTGTSELGQLKELERILGNLTNDYKQMKYTRDALKEALILSGKINRQLGGLTGEGLMLQGINVIIEKILSNYIVPLKKSEDMTERESEIVRLKLTKFAATVLANQPVPARLYIISRNSVELKIRTKRVVESIQDEISQYSKATDAMTLARLFEKTSVILEEAVRLRQAELRKTKKLGKV